jgi:hypothetical protein
VQGRNANKKCRENMIPENMISECYAVKVPNQERKVK